MVEIYNRSRTVNIKIDDSLDWVQVTPKTYIEPKHIIIEFKNGFDFFQHVNECKECEMLLSSFGSFSNDWFLKYNNSLFKINTDDIGLKEFGSNQIIKKNSFFEFGSKITLSLFELDYDELEFLEKKSLETENYETACVFRDLKNELNSSNI